MFNKQQVRLAFAALYLQRVDCPEIRIFVTAYQAYSAHMWTYIDRAMRASGVPFDGGNQLIRLQEAIRGLEALHTSTGEHGILIQGLVRGLIISETSSFRGVAYSPLLVLPPAAYIAAFVSFLESRLREGRNGGWGDLAHHYVNCYHGRIDCVFMQFVPMRSRVGVLAGNCSLVLGVQVVDAERRTRVHLGREIVSTVGELRTWRTSDGVFNRTITPFGGGVDDRIPLFVTHSGQHQCIAASNFCVGDVPLWPLCDAFLFEAAAVEIGRGICSPGTDRASRYSRHWNTFISNMQEIVSSRYSVNLTDVINHQYSPQENSVENNANNEGQPVEGPPASPVYAHLEVIPQGLDDDDEEPDDSEEQDDDYDDSDSDGDDGDDGGGVLYLTREDAIAQSIPGGLSILPRAAMAPDFCSACHEIREIASPNAWFGIMTPDRAQAFQGALCGQCLTLAARGVANSQAYGSQEQEVVGIQDYARRLTAHSLMVWQRAVPAGAVTTIRAHPIYPTIDAEYIMGMPYLLSSTFLETPAEELEVAVTPPAPEPEAQPVEVAVEESSLDSPVTLRVLLSALEKHAANVTVRMREIAREEVQNGYQGRSAGDSRIPEVAAQPANVTGDAVVAAPSYGGGFLPR